MYPRQTNNRAQPPRASPYGSFPSPQNSRTPTFAPARHSSQGTMTDLPNSPRANVTQKIKEDCYNKIINDKGTPVREITYMAHITIQEFSQYSATPPPPNLATGQLGSVKDRILVLCTKYSGRVLLQKGKFNDSKGVYQIGRTWDLDEIQAVTRAGNDGFILSLNKDYFWKSNEGSDKIVKFMKTLTKTYGAFTGKYPVLNGYTLEDLGLSQIPQKKSFSNNPNSNEVLQPQIDSQLLKSKSLKRKHLPNPVLPVEPTLRQNSQSSFTFNDPSAYSTPNTSEVYKDIDFTANGKVPVKPMKIMDRVNTSQSTLEDLNTSTDMLNSSVDGSRTNVYRKSTHSIETPKSSQHRDTPKSIPSLNTSSLPYPSGEDLADDSQSFIFDDGHKSNSSPTKSFEGMEQDASLNFRLENRLSRNDFGIEEVDDTDDESKPVFSRKVLDESVEEFEASQSVSVKRFSGKSLVSKNVSNSVSNRDVSNDPQLTPRRSHPIDPQSVRRSHPPNTVTNEEILNELQTYMEDFSEPSTSKNDENESDEVSEIRSFSMDEDTGLSREITDVDTETELDLNIKKKNKRDHVEKDAEIEEVLDDIQWGVFDTTDELVNKMTAELNKIKYNNVKQLISLDFSGDSMKQDLTSSLDEVENLNHIFKRMEIDLKNLGTDINSIENNSQGLQVKSINKKALFKQMNSMMNKTSLKDSDLNTIESFKDFDRLGYLNNIEAQVQYLYNALSASDESNKELQQMNSFVEYQKRYKEVAKRFSKHFSAYFKSQFSSRISQLNDMDRIYPKSIMVELNGLTIYSCFTYFLKEISPNDFNELKFSVTNILSDFIEKILELRLKHVHYATPTIPNIGNFDASDSMSLKKSRTLRLSSRRDKLIGKLGLSNDDPSSPKATGVTATSVEQPIKPAFLNSDSIEDTKTIVDIVNDTKEISVILTCFIGDIFHYNTNINSFDEFMKVNPLEKRMTNLDKYSIEDGVNYSSEVVSLLNTVFGKYSNLFIKKIVPIEYNIPLILNYLYKLSKDSKDQEFFVMNFLRKVTDKYTTIWTKFIKGLIESINQSSINSKSGIVPAIKNVNQFFHLTELTLDKSSRSWDSEDNTVDILLSDSYRDIIQACIHLFGKDDPLLKNNEFDEKERNHRNVSILQNVFSMIEELSIYPNERSNRIKAQLDTVFKNTQTKYFTRILLQKMGKLIEFVEAYESITDSHIKSKKYTKKTVRSILDDYTTSQLKGRAIEIHKKMEKHFISGSNMFEKDLLDKLWADLEKQLVSIFFRLEKILRSDFRDIEYVMTKQEIHSIFRNVA